MRIFGAVAITCLLLAEPPHSSGQTGSKTLKPKSAAVDLCAALEVIQPGDRLPVVIKGTYDKNGHLWDSFEPYCNRRVQPVTVVHMATGVQKSKELVEHLEKDGQAVVTFSGTLWGPPRPNSDLPELHQNRAYLMRVSGLRRYDNEFQTQLIVDEILSAWPASQPGAPRWFTNVRSPFPIVQQAMVPASYPNQAANVGAYGDVVVEIELKRGNVLSTKVISAADRLLIEDTLANIKTWVFEPEAEATFTTTFSYRFEDELPSTTPSVRVRTELPVKVEIIAPRNNW